MCDEYDDERMRAFWRRLEIEEELPREVREPKELELPVVAPPASTPEVRTVRPRPLTR